MFDSINVLTPETLKQQQNTLNKAFHLDNDAKSEAYSQKINVAYD